MPYYFEQHSYAFTGSETKFENKIRLALYTKSVKKEMEQKLEFVMQMGQRI